MSYKMTAADAETTLDRALFGYKDRAAAVKAEHETARQAILADKSLSTFGVGEKVQALNQQTRAKLDSIKGEQTAFVSSLKSQLEADVRGKQPADVNAVLSRRDAADRARKLTDQQEALDVLNDAIRNGDADMAHAVAARARNVGMEDVTDAYREAFASTAESAAALSYVEEVTTGMAYNMSNSITFSGPTD